MKSRMLLLTAVISAVSSQDALCDRIDETDDISPHLDFAIPVYPAYILYAIIHS